MSIAVPDDTRPSGRKAVFAWFLYDWAARSVPTVVTTFVFGTYFTQGVAENPAEGLQEWAAALAVAGILTAVLAPALGALADRGGALKPWLLTATLASVVATGLLWFVRPHVGDADAALVLLIASIVGYEVATSFYNALLPGLAAGRRFGRLSGQGWAVGAVGGLVCLAVCLFGLIRAEPPPFDLDPNEAEPVRAAALVAATWYLVFALPLFRLVPDRAGRGTVQTRPVDGELAPAPLAAGPQRGATLRFLAASLLSLTATETIVALGGIYAAATFQMRVEEVLTFGVGILASGAAGSLLAGWIDDRLGPSRVLLLTLAALLVLGGAALDTGDVDTFRLLGFGIGFCLGPADSVGRSLMARLVPRERAGRLFGFYALSRYGARAAGPLTVAAVTTATGSMTIGMAAMLGFIAVGFLLLLTVEVPRREV